MKVADAVTTHRFAVDLGKYQVDAVRSVCGLTYGQHVVESKSASPAGELVTSMLPGERQTGKVTITRAMDKNKAFTDWVKESREKRNPDTARQNVTIVIMDGEKNPIRRFQLLGAWASEWTVSCLEADGTGPAIEQVTIVYDDCTVD